MGCGSARSAAHMPARPAAKGAGSGFSSGRRLTRPQSARFASPPYRFYSHWLGGPGATTRLLPLAGGTHALAARRDRVRQRTDPVWLWLCGRPCARHVAETMALGGSSSMEQR